VEQWVKCIMRKLRMWAVVCPLEGIVNSYEWACVGVSLKDDGPDDGPERKWPVGV